MVPKRESLNSKRGRGDTVVRKRKLTLANGVAKLARTEDFDELRKEARSLGLETDRIFSGSAGSFSWTYDSKTGK